LEKSESQKAIIEYKHSSTVFYPQSRASVVQGRRSRFFNLLAVINQFFDLDAHEEHMWSLYGVLSISHSLKTSAESDDKTINNL
jgi:hypothetical protein